MRGRRPEPAARKEAKGNPGRRKIGRDPASTELADATNAPTWLRSEAKAIWTRLAPDLVAMNLLKRVDAMTFGRYCENFALWLSACERVQKSDLVVTTESDHVVMDRLNKYLQAMLLLEKRLVDIEDRFGLNPANRQRIFAMRASSAAAPGELPLDGGRGERPGRSVPAQGTTPIGLLN